MVPGILQTEYGGRSKQFIAKYSKQRTMVPPGKQDYHSGPVTKSAGRKLLIAESRALLSRLEQIKPFEWSMTMVPAAAPSPAAMRQIHHLIRSGRTELRGRVERFVGKLKRDFSTPLSESQSEYSILRLRFNALLDEFDIFADVINQRSEHDTGIWVAGLDILARDAMHLKGNYYRMPELVCYLDRGHGAAIRRTRTRLPGGGKNPVAVIKIPRERMVGSGIGSSLVHEVGHQVAALLKLIESLKPLLIQNAQRHSDRSVAWNLYAQWISEILSDLWSVGMLGISATNGLMNVVSLPSYFVFRLPEGGPHPFPWIRVKISIAFGKAMYPDSQWDTLERIWHEMYPVGSLNPAHRKLLTELTSVLPVFVDLVLSHRPPSLAGRSLGEVFPVSQRTPVRLRQLYQRWKDKPELMLRARPCLVFATVGQARADDLISPENESRLITWVLRQWALIKIVNN